jgi:hypothetical protein
MDKSRVKVRSSFTFGGRSEFGLIMLKNSTLKSLNWAYGTVNNALQDTSKRRWVFNLNC